jgi:hypothetical protein
MPFDMDFRHRKARTWPQPSSQLPEQAAQHSMEQHGAFITTWVQVEARRRSALTFLPLIAVT